MKINETRKRSLLKAISFRIIEVAVDVLILLFLVKKMSPLTPSSAIWLALMMEGSCFVVHFIFERIWNKIQWGREIV